MCFVGVLFLLESGWDPGPYARLTSTLSPGDTPSPCFAFQMTILAGVLDASIHKGEVLCTSLCTQDTLWLNKF